MKRQEEIKIFLRKVLDGDLNSKDIKKFSQADFKSDLKVYCLEKIKSLLFSLKTNYLEDTYSAPQKLYNLANTIKDDDYNFNIMDYCLLSGEQELNKILDKIGAEHSFTNPRLEKLCQIGLIGKEQVNHHATVATINKSKTPTPWYKKISGIFKGRYKLAIFLFIVGVGCLCAAPFTGGITAGVGGALFIGVGIPSFIASCDVCKDAGLSGQDVNINISLDLINSIRDYIDDLLQHTTTNNNHHQCSKLHRFSTSEDLGLLFSFRKTSTYCNSIDPESIAKVKLKKYSTV